MMQIRFVGIMFCLILLTNHANAQTLPNNPWLNTKSEAYIPAQSEYTDDKSQVQAAKTPTTINVNFNILMNYFADSSAEKTHKSLQPNAAIIDFLQNINFYDTTNTKDSTQSSNPLNEAAQTYNQYLKNMQHKYNQTKQNAEKFYQDKMNTLKNIQQNTIKNIRNILK